MIRCREPRTTGRGCESAQGSVSGERFGHPGEGSSEAGVEQSFCREPNDLAHAHLVESADTGAREHEATFLADVFGLVEPDDVRWIVISHDDVDHTGNLNALAAAAPNANDRHRLVHGRTDGRVPGSQPVAIALDGRR